MRSLAAVAATSRAKMGAENFPVALRVVPATARDELQRLYAFARFVDDVGDDPDELLGADADRAALLALVADDVRLLPDGAPQLAPVAGLEPLTRGGRVPVQPFLDLVAANEMDQRVSRYETFDDLLGYCALSAAPVGRVVLHIAGAATDSNVTDSDTVCAALQVLEHCQDVGEDARAGRVYLPQADLAAHRVDVAALTAATTDVALRAVVAVQVRRSRALLAEGRPLVRRLSGWARLAVAGYVAGGLATADALEAGHYDVLPETIRPTKARTLWHALRLLGSRR
jgi:squalene synthase HpnC